MSERETRFTLVTPQSMGFWWPLIKSGLARMEHHFAMVDGDPLMELEGNLYAGKLYAYIASDIIDGDLTKPDPRAMVVLAPGVDPGTNGRILWIYALYAFQSPISKDMLAKGGEFIQNMAKKFRCGKIMAQVQDRDMKRYVKALKWFTGEITMFTMTVDLSSPYAGYHERHRESDEEVA